MLFSLPILQDLSKLPPGKIGWPWTKPSKSCSTQMLNGSNWPLISVVTPSYNQGEFIEETIRSVLLQGYPNLEYIIIDGGSDDGTTKVVEKYLDYIAYYVSEPDRGQAHAINKGLKKASGDILCWLNSDDLFEPNTLWTVAEYFTKNKSNFVYGDGWVFNNKKPGNKKYCKRGNFNANTLTYCDPLLQPSTFWNRKIIDEIGFLDESLKYVLDWDFFIRISQNNKLDYLPLPLSSYRIHESHKTGNGGLAREQEILKIIEQYASPEWRNIYNRIKYYHCKNKILKNISGKLYILIFFLNNPSLVIKHQNREIRKALSMI